VHTIARTFLVAKCCRISLSYSFEFDRISKQNTKKPFEWFHRGNFVKDAAKISYRQYNNLYRLTRQLEKACCKGVSVTDESVCISRQPRSRFESVVYALWS